MSNISRIWSMPNSNTFEIKPIKELISRYLTPSMVSIDPFANKSKLATITNDIDPQYKTDFNLEAIEFIKLHKEVDFIFNDPPYSPRQVSECYKKLNRTVNMQTTQSSFWGNLKKEIANSTKKGGYVLSCSWNSNGIGKTLGFEIVELLIIPHGGWHNDTIVVLERKIV